MKEYLTVATIAASPERVWDVLTNGAAYGEWNPEIVGIDGVIAPNAKIRVHVRLGDGAVRRVGQRIVALDPPRRMEWVGGLPFGLFVGRRTFTLKPVATGTEFRMHLQMSGPLSAMILKSVGDRQPEIERFSAGLKQRAEGRS
ncbi:MAG: SRPBCC family protein [Gemmatimonadaceae bacterium]